MSEVKGADSASAKSFIAALVFNAAVFGVELGVFTLVRPYFKAIYEPRTYAPQPSKRAKPLSTNILLWPLAVWRADYRDIKNVNGMDAYFFVRFLRMMVKVFLPIWLISWAVLFPVTAVRTSSSASTDNLSKLTFGNVGDDDRKRYSAHLILAWFSTFWIFYNIKNEMRHFITTRQQHLIEPNHAKSLQANTILITGIPERYLNQRSLHMLFEDLPGGVKKIWLNRNLKELPDIYDRRLEACNKLESAETTLLRTAAKLRLEEQKKKGDKVAADEDTDVKKDADPEAADIETATSIVPRDQRPTHRLGALPFTGKKVDTVEWAREEIKECNRLLEEGRETIEDEDEAFSEEQTQAADQTTGSDQSHKKSFKPTAVVKEATGALKHTTTMIKGKVTARISGHGDMKYPPFNSAFVTFHKQIGAHLAVQALAHHEPYRMTAKYNEVSPQDVIWANLNMNPYEQKIRVAISYAFTAGLIILWSFPVAFVGAVSNIAGLCDHYKWLAWICTLPPPVVGIISGILPPVMLAILMALLPIVLRLLARFEGIPKYTGLELSLMTRYFIFQVVHSFLIVTLSAGIIAALGPLVSNPTSIPNILATELPKASTFFLTYIILQGLSGTAGGFLQIVPLIIYYVKLVLLGSTPRSVYNIKYVLRNVAWGTLFPVITLLCVISLAYSIISPVINGLACATFFAFYQLYKYVFLWVYEQSPASDTGGLFFPKAIQHVFVGLYIEEICLCALFFLAHTVVEGALMVVLIVITAGFHIIINNSYGPLLYALPLSLKDKTYSPVEGVSEHNHDVQSSGAGSSTHDVTKKDRDVEGDGGIQYVDVEYKNSDKEKNINSGSDKDTQPDAIARQKFEEDEFGFAHPAVSRPQRIVWIPHDTLGLGEEEMRGCEEMGISASMQGAVMNEGGKVDVPRADEVPEEIVVNF
ncbi:DUF221-domain-containing protein [Macrolepiota fuliginosa MF-IS2]|uniref:DUF221-domain-containing protein n=1 Tax=Macrolepiota fuliginosa MF-IS2 TaxID=1400762 RepID=A0A9P5XEG6_9AGAR|nr:DUF221-domain-containing protein [Macrolepiota fuliginosa MF-IS2]